MRSVTLNASASSDHAVVIVVLLSPPNASYRLASAASGAMLTTIVSLPSVESTLRLTLLYRSRGWNCHDSVAPACECRVVVETVCATSSTSGITSTGNPSGDDANAAFPCRVSSNV